MHEALNTIRRPVGLAERNPHFDMDSVEPIGLGKMAILAQGAWRLHVSGK